MKRRMLILLGCALSFLAQAQQAPAMVDSLKQKIALSKTPDEKVDLLGRLSRILISTNKAESDQYADEMTREAEFSRNRKLMVKAMLINAERHSYLNFNKDYVQKAIGYYEGAASFARQNKLDREQSKALLGLAEMYMHAPDYDRAFNYTNQAFGIISQLKNDTMSVAVYNTYGNIYELKKDRIQALRNYLNALRIAEEGKHHGLLRNCYSYLSNFYAGIKAYDKSIDYFAKAMAELPLAKPENEKYMRVVDMYSLGNLYMMKKDRNLAIYYYDRSIRMADSINYATLKMPGYQGLLNQYLEDEPAKALRFLNERADLKEYIVNFNAGYIIDYAYASIYYRLNQYDSARLYFEKAAPGYEKASTPPLRMHFYNEYAKYFKQSGNSDKAIAYFTAAKSIADVTKDLEWQEHLAAQLDSTYAASGDYKQARLYNGMYHQYRDSLQKLGEEKDLLQMELADEEQRQARIEEEKAAALRERHNIQYMGITIAIAAVFTLLVLMGAFRVSEVTIKVMGFFAFILLFEFIILIADNKIHHWTHGEPLPILGIKIVLIAILLPLHHWLEHKVVHYLAHKRLIIPTGKSIWSGLATTVRRKKKAEMNEI